MRPLATATLAAVALLVVVTMDALGIGANSAEQRAIALAGFVAVVGIVSAIALRRSS